MNVPGTREIPGARPHRSRRSKVLIVVGISIIVLGFAIGSYFYRNHIAKARLQAAIALTDRLDPGWRLEEIEARRQIIPDQENSTRQITLARRLIDAQLKP